MGGFENQFDGVDALLEAKRELERIQDLAAQRLLEKKREETSEAVVTSSGVECRLRVGERVFRWDVFL